MIQPGDHLRQDDEEVLANNQWGKIKPKYWGDKVALIDCFRRPKVAATAQPETPTPRTDAFFFARTLVRELHDAREATAKAQATLETVERELRSDLLNALAARDNFRDNFREAQTVIAAERAERERAEEEAEDQFQTERVRAIKAEKEQENSKLRSSALFRENETLVKNIDTLLAKLAEARQQRDAAQTYSQDFDRLKANLLNVTRERDAALAELREAKSSDAVKDGEAFRWIEENKPEIKFDSVENRWFVNGHFGPLTGSLGGAIIVAIVKQHAARKDSK